MHGVEALAQLARLGVPEPHLVTDAQRGRATAEQRRLHLTGGLEGVELETVRDHRAREPVSRRRAGRDVAAAEPAVTEVAAGSGLFGPTLFDTYRAFRPRPAAFFVLPVVRKPSSRVATALGGGYPASGAAGRDRLPRPVLPPGLRLDAREGAGEVQTPLLGADGLRVGDRVWFRHAKAGELCERFDVVHVVKEGAVVDSVPTYRGEGKTFL